MKPKIFVYPAANPHLHDTAGKFKNTVPLSQHALRRQVEVVKAKECHFFYMGQFEKKHRDHLLALKNWPHFDRYQARHILDLEGDWKFQEQPGKEIPRLIDNCIITMNAADRDRFGGLKVFVRPNISMLMLDLMKREIPFTSPRGKDFFFRGKPDIWGSRERCRSAMKKANLPGTFEWTSSFRGHSPVKSGFVRSFEKDILDHTINLCPRGSGPDSVRFYEVCAFGRVPILVGNNILPGEESHDMSWLLRIDYRSNDEEMAAFFQKVHEMPLSELEERARGAKNYFDTVIRSYFKDPTGAFISWLERRDLLPD